MPAMKPRRGHITSTVVCSERTKINISTWMGWTREILRLHSATLRAKLTAVDVNLTLLGSFERISKGSPEYTAKVLQAMSDFWCCGKDFFSFTLHSPSH
jgi:hypothetical protein